MQAVGAEFEYIAFLDSKSLGAEVLEIKRNHSKRLGGSHDRNLRILCYRFGNEGSVVRLHMVHNQIIRSASPKLSVKPVLPQLRCARIGSIEYGNLFVKDEI